MKEWPPPEAKSPKLLWWERASSQVMIPLRGTRATGAPLASAEDEVMPLAPVAIWSRRGASVAPQSSRSQVSSSAGKGSFSEVAWTEASRRAAKRDFIVARISAGAFDADLPCHVANFERRDDDGKIALMCTWATTLTDHSGLIQHGSG